jgi:hypothetical protein
MTETLKPRGRRSVPTAAQSTARARRDRAESKAIATKQRELEQLELDRITAELRKAREEAQR